MSTRPHEVTYHTTINLTVRLDATDEDDAADRAWSIAEDFLQTVLQPGTSVTASASLDGVGADEVTELDPTSD